MKTELNKEQSTELNKELNKESEFKGCRVNGFVMLFVNLIMLLGVAFLIFLSATATETSGAVIFGVLSGLLFVLNIIWLCGYVMLEPNECTAMVFFGKYRGTFYKTGLSWVHPFMTAKKVSLRQKNLNVDPIKVNDKNGNPILIGLVLVWKVKNVYKAMFDIDTDNSANMTASNRMRQFESFVRVQSDAALRQVAGEYAYDNLGNENHELTLRSGGDEINAQLINKLNERLEMSGLEVLEARINYLAYAPEIAAVMLRRQQAEAIISAREKIVEGAVTMVKMAIDKLSDDNVVDLDNDKKAAMVSNLLVVLCADESAQPVVNTGTLNQ